MVTEDHDAQVTEPTDSYMASGNWSIILHLNTWEREVQVDSGTVPWTPPPIDTSPNRASAGALAVALLAASRSPSTPHCDGLNYGQSAAL